jgi:CRISPR-associated endonuclease/helicase Cas3
VQPKLTPDTLLAKSMGKTWMGTYSLVGHTSAVVNAVTTLIDTLGERLISQFGLQCDFSKLRATARLAAYLHDWGKANDHFQMVVRHKRNPLESPQLIRHEVASVLLAWEYREWLQQCDGDFLTALAAAGGHHLKLGGNVKDGDTGELGEVRTGTGSDRLYLYTDPKYFKGLLKYGVQALGLPRELKLSHKRPTCWQITELKQKRDEVLGEFLNWQHDPAFTAVVKALVIAGDAVGSALPTTGLKIEDWIKQEVSHTLNEAEIQQVVDARLDGKELLPFQIEMGNSHKRVTLVRAGCGTGKTLGAYNWAKTYATGGKLFFCYPTTGTSTEGFIDYVHSKVDSVLLHSRAAVDLEHLAQTGDEDDLETKLESFKAWGAKVSVCTVDTVLGLLQCNRRPLYCFPAIAQAAFVFDEVHCYDDRLFGALLRFLEVVKAPVLLMSASFLPWQLEAIKKAVGEPIEIIKGPKKIEEDFRYRFHLIETPDDKDVNPSVWQRVQQELVNNGKVLWVCNQVGTAIAVYQEAKKLGLNAVLYHSRYRYMDRVRHHREVVDAFKKDKPILAIATQVAEMSLDLSSTLLVSQIADPAGLIQRLGRLNRRYCGHALDAIFYPDPKVGFPYPKEDLQSGKTMVETFTDEVSQANLADWLEQSVTQGTPDKDTVLLDKNWQTYPAPCRKEGHTVTALLAQDLARVAKMSAKLLPRYTIPLLAKETKGWKRHKKGYPIAPSDQWGYSADLGAYQL